MYTSNTDQAEFRIFLCGEFNFPFIRYLHNDQADAADGYIIGTGSTTAVTNQTKSNSNQQINTFLTKLLKKTRNTNISDLVFVQSLDYLKNIKINKTVISEHNVIENSFNADILRRNAENNNLFREHDFPAIEPLQCRDRLSKYTPNTV